ncbi:phosphotransferase enzyme family protein [Streptoalloteichus tenebrarius]|nr:phosphotransferase [Streptoalloteichus tenebrarius]BFF04490.1 hypothetical protein GCM10020241_61650 [Streptoalloteichus tenebrarius]
MPTALRMLLAARYEMDLDEGEPLLGVSDKCVLWRVERPRPLVVRIARRARASELEWCYRVAVDLAETVPEVVTPLPTTEGRLVVDWADGPVSLWPHVEGDHVDRDDAGQRVAAARLLARLHQAATRLDPGPRPSRPGEAPPDPVLAGPHGPGAFGIYGGIGEFGNRGGAEDPDGMGDRAEVEDPETDPERDRELDCELDRELDRALDRWRATEGDAYPRGVAHGDFCRRNLLWRDGRVVGLLDWDDVRHGWLASELAWATWEFAKNRDNDRMIADRAAGFLAAYRDAGGPPYPEHMIVPFVRCGLRAEIRQARAARAAGVHYDPEYAAASLRAYRAAELTTSRS